MDQPAITRPDLTFSPEVSDWVRETYDAAKRDP